MNAIEKKLKALKMYQENKIIIEMRQAGCSYRAIYTMWTDLYRMKNNFQKLETHYKTRLAKGYSNY